MTDTHIIATGKIGGPYTVRLRPLDTPGLWELYRVRPASGTCARDPLHIHQCTVHGRDIDEATRAAVRCLHDPDIRFTSDLAGTASRDPAAWRY